MTFGEHRVGRHRSDLYSLSLALTGRDSAERLVIRRLQRLVLVAPNNESNTRNAAVAAAAFADACGKLRSMRYGFPCRPAELTAPYTAPCTIATNTAPAGGADVDRRLRIHRAHGDFVPFRHFVRRLCQRRRFKASPEQSSDDGTEESWAASGCRYQREAARALTGAAPFPGGKAARACATGRSFCYPSRRCCGRHLRCRPLPRRCVRFLSRRC